MKPEFQLLLFCCIISVTACAQKSQSTSLNIGDPAPPLRVQKWVKGKPIQSFKKGKVYVVDFWATWCRSCMASMPYLSELAHRYKDKVIFLAIDVWENKYRPHTPAQIKALVDTMGQQMNFFVAIDDYDLMADNWVKASYEQSIPLDLVVNAQGRIAWIGNPAETGTKEIDRFYQK